MTGGKVRAIYLILYMAFATWRVYYNVYLEENHFSGVQIGVINALIQSTLFIVVPIWGVIADKRGIRPSLRIAVTVSALILLSLGYLLNFWVLMIVILLLTLFHHPIGPLTDALAVQFAVSDKKYNYGNLRMWGSLGWAIASILTGYAFKRLDLKYAFPLSGLLFLSSLFLLQTPKSPKTKLYHPHFQNISLRELAKNKALLFFIFILFIYGVACSPVNAYMNLYFTELGADNYTIGIAYSIQALSEIPFFLVGNYLLKRIGTRWVIIISMIVMLLRLFVYALFPDITTGIIMGALQGITLSFFLVGVVDFLHKQLPAGRHATAQSILWGLYFGLGHTAGNLIIGILKDTNGMIGVMHIFAYFTLAILVTTTLDFLIIYRKKKLALASGSEN
jgi:MFS transporter, PPP family, 3-phenylpropionic acid transporter